MIRVDDLEDLAREERDGTGPEAFRPFGLDDLRDRDEQDRLERAAERAAALRAVSITTVRRDQLVAAAHRQMPARRVPVGRLLLALAGIAAVAAGFSYCLVYLFGVVL